MDIHAEHVWKRSDPSLKKRCGHIDFSAENMRTLGSCLYYLVLVYDRVFASYSNFELVFVSRIPQIRLKKSVTEIL